MVHTGRWCCARRLLRRHAARWACWLGRARVVAGFSNLLYDWWQHRHGRCCGAAVAVLVALGAGQCTEGCHLINAPIEVIFLVVVAALGPQRRGGGVVGEIPMGGRDLKSCAFEAHRRRDFCLRR